MKPSALAAEFLGVFALCFIGMLAIANFGTVPGGLLAIALAHGVIFGVMVTAMGPISGAHFNPATSLALFFLKKIEAGPLLGYMLAQVLGGMAAAIAVRVCTSEVAASSGVPALASTTGAGQGIALEAFATFFMVLAVILTAVDRRAPKMGGLFVGLAIAVGILAIGPMTGGALNPARHIGPAIVAGNLNNALVWLVGPMVGALLAAAVYSFLFEEKPEADEAVKTKKK
jgi:aquaporin Z